VASAVDTRHSSDSPSAIPSKNSRENAPANPQMNTIACEVQVIATGARPSENGGQRELFTEETATALVFENGGVLRLSAEVVPGQLLFLTHKETKREVVAQVTRKRDFRPMSCYVEIEFCEPSPGFWGIEFREMPSLVPANAQKEMDESAQAEEDIIADEPGAPTPAPSAQEVTALKNEVETLREQLKLLQTKIVPGNSPTPAVTPDLSRTTDPKPPRASVDVRAQAHVRADAPTEPLAKLQAAAGEVSQKLPTELSGALASAHVARPAASTSLPIDRAEPPFSEADLQPNSKHKQKVAANTRPVALRKGLLIAAFLLVAAGTALYQNSPPWLPQSKNVFHSTAPSIAVHPAPHAPQKTANTQANSVKSPQTSEALTTPPHAVLHDASQPAPLGTAKLSTLAVPETPAAIKSAPEGAANAAAVQGKPEIAASVGKRSAPLPSSKAALVSVAPRSDGVAIVPPKLIKSVRAIVSPDALRDFATSNANSVTLDALVDTSGHVKSMKALSGSPSLQRAAMEALNQYKYKPATQRGKPVPAHITVKIKFLFER
jgi:TonB family protein